MEGNIELFFVLLFSLKIIKMRKFLIISTITFSIFTDEVQMTLQITAHLVLPQDK